ncbi:FAD/NAD(P)-binding protein [Streptomyces cupreus]|uniref:FAD/NAD(P)-binding protein n=1 Tax=Streptomyces cupreus TaxID=2759956 RepID=A0A7X1J8I4_9ACTN|nr:FAD/NAD(P)-binding protein [Streptomyces cupreus]MBC2905585.1 FAD/NAD(P)-binding protein [Streptomyces cupreus]
MTTRQHTVCVIGAGPRGLSVIERLCAAARAAAPDTTVGIHVVDPHAPGAGQVWRTSQSAHLLMNTVAGQISVFTDASVELTGPLEPGPSLHAWARSLVAGDIPGHHPDHVLAEARELGPDTYPTRAFYGHYLRWAFDRTVAGAPDCVTVTWHRARAVALDDEAAALATGHPPRQTVTLDDGTALEHLDSVVLAQGHLPARPTAVEEQFADLAREYGHTHLAPSNPADTDLECVRPGQPVLLRGLGLNFFDYMALLTTGRGGSFTRVYGRLVYLPSGREPRLYAGSRRGVPYQARGENEKGPHGRHEPLLLTPARTARMRAARGSGGADFLRDVWPLVAKEVETVYYRTLLVSRGRADRAEAFQRAFLSALPGTSAEETVLDAYEIGEKDRWDWDRLSQPYQDQEFGSPEDFTAWLLDHLREDVAEARSGNVSGPLKAALDVLRDLRNEIRLVVDHGGLHGDSHREHLDRWYTPLNAFLSIGPPASRIEEAAALIEAGVLHIVGPDLRVDVDRHGFHAHSPLVPGSRISTEVLIEARLPDITLSRTEDPLLRHLLDTGQCATHRIATRNGTWIYTEGLAVTPRPFQLLDAARRPHPRRYAFGVPTESVHWVTAAGIRPGVNSVTLTDSDAIAQAALGAVLEQRDSLQRTAA